jgi:hypothetical protein
VFCLEDNEPDTATLVREHMETMKACVSDVVKLTQAAAANPAVVPQRDQTIEKFGAACAQAHALSKHPATLQCVVDRGQQTFRAQAQTAAVVDLPNAQGMTAEKGFMGADGQVVQALTLDMPAAGGAGMNGPMQMDLLTAAKGVLDGMSSLADTFA